VTRLLAESSSFLWHHLANLAHNHLETLAVSTIHSDCHFMMRTGESMLRIKPVARMPCSHTLCFNRCWGVFNLGPRALKMLRAPRYLNPAMAARDTDASFIVSFEHYAFTKAMNAAYIILLT